MKALGAALPPPRGGILRRGERGRGPRQVRFELEAAAHAGNEEDCEAPPPPPPILGTPAPHSSRWGAPPPPLSPPQFDPPLGGFYRARGDGGAAAINVPPTQRLFRGLISLSVPPPPEPRRGVLPPPPPPSKDPGPELTMLTGGGKGQEGPFLPPFAPPEPPRPLPSPPQAAFLMYRKLQQWGGG